MAEISITTKLEELKVLCKCNFLYHCVVFHSGF